MSTVVTELPPEAYYDLSWTDLIPWLADYAPGSVRELADIAPAPDWWLTESPGVTAMAVAHDVLCGALAAVIITRYPDTALHAALPTIPVRLPVVALPIGARARTALQRLNIRTVGDLGRWTTEDLLGKRDIGSGMADEIIIALVHTAITRPAEDVLLSGGTGDAVAVTTRSEVTSPAQLQLLDDLVQLAQWRHVSGCSSEALFNVVVEEGAPEEIRAAVLRINSITALDLTPPLGTLGPIAQFAARISKLDDRQKTVLRERLLTPYPKTLGALGEQLDLSREEVAEMERVVKDLMVPTLHSGTAIGDLVASLRTEVQPAAALDRLTTMYPDLAREVPGLQVPFWFVLDRLADHLEVTDGWVTSPNANGAWDHTRTLLENLADEHGVVELVAASTSTTIPESEFRDWLTWCGYVLHEGHVLMRTGTVADHAVGVLDAVGEPLTLKEILERMGKPREMHALRTVVAEDQRFMRADIDTWALVGWEINEAEVIPEQIGRWLYAKGGRMHIDSLVKEITGRHDVSAQSVRKYADSGDFEVVEGIVRRQKVETPHEQEAWTPRARSNGVNAPAVDTGPWRTEMEESWFVLWGPDIRVTPSGRFSFPAREARHVLAALRQVSAEPEVAQWAAADGRSYTQAMLARGSRLVLDPVGSSRDPSGNPASGVSVPYADLRRLLEVLRAWVDSDQARNVFSWWESR